MNNFAFVFPGQGVQRVGMGRGIYEKFPQARDVLDSACKILGESRKNVMFNGPEKELSRMSNTHLSVFLANIMIYSIIKDALGKEPLFAAGHGLGEYCAVYAAGCLDLGSALKLLVIRARMMEKFSPAGSMAAVIGLEKEEVVSMCGLISLGGKFIEAVNFDSEKQTVVAGTAEAIEALKNTAKARVIPLSAKGPFHSLLMRPVQKRYNKELSNFYFSDPAFPVVSNFRGVAEKTSGEILHSLENQIAAPVKWVSSVQFMRGNGVEVFIECAEKSILSPLIKNIVPEAKTINALSLVNSA
ncbi:MAG: ACP S-malonyltransferase [bacterium]